MTDPASHVQIAEKKDPPAELARGLWGWSPDQLPKGSILVYELDTWYRNGKGAEFMILEPPRMVSNRTGFWVGDVLLADGRVVALVWGPNTRKVSWWSRVMRGWFKGGAT